jgi:hypothetical protein
MSASPACSSHAREDTVVDADYPRARSIIEHYERLRILRDLMALADQPDHPAHRLFDELHLRVRVLEDDGLAVRDIAELELQCSALQAHLLEAAVLRHDWITNQQRADDEARQNQVNQELGRMMNPGGLADRLRERIRRLQT